MSTPRSTALETSSSAERTSSSSSSSSTSTSSTSSSEENDNEPLQRSPIVETVESESDDDSSEAEELETEDLTQTTRMEGNQPPEPPGTADNAEDDRSTDTTMIAAVGQQQGVRLFDESKCGVRLSTRVQGRVLICGNPKAECSRRFHQQLQRDPSRVGRPGYYMTTYNATSTVLDGLEDSFETVEAWEARRLRNRSDLETQGNNAAASEGDPERHEPLPPIRINAPPAEPARPFADPLTGEALTRQEQIRRWADAVRPATEAAPTIMEVTPRATGGTNLSRQPEAPEVGTQPEGLPNANAGDPVNPVQLNEAPPPEATNGPRVPPPPPGNPPVMDAVFMTAIGDQVAQLSRQMNDATAAYQRLAAEITNMQRNVPNPQALVTNLGQQAHQTLTQEGGPANQPPSYYYAVFRGRRTGVFRDDAEWARLLISGYPEARMKRFHTEEAAKRWLQSKQAEYERSQHGDEGSVGSETVLGDQPPRFGRGYSEEAPTQPPAVPRELTGIREAPADQVVDIRTIGPDKSTGTPGKLYETSIQVESEVLKLLCPRGVAASVRQELMETAVDVAALPGKSSVLASSSSSTADSAIIMDQFAEAVGGLADPHSRRTGSAPRDSQWRLGTKNALEKVKSGTDLRDVTEELGSHREHALTNMDGQVREILFHAGLSTANVELYCSSGLLMRLVRASSDAFYELHLHLLYLWMEHPNNWDEVGKEHLSYHALQLGRIRRFAITRTQLVLRTYTYLRDSRATGFQDVKLLGRITRRLQEAAYPHDDASNPRNLPRQPLTAKQWTCSHCHDPDETLHKGGAKSCPAKDLTTRKARQLAKDALKLVKDGDQDAFTRMIKEAA